MKIYSSAIYAGTFDPITVGHLDLIERASRIFDRLIIAVARDTRKATMFSAEDRAEMVREVARTVKNVEVELFDGLLVDYARKSGVHVLIRGLRAYSDFEYEFQMALTNRKMVPDIETLFLMPKETHSYISSSTVREIASLGGNIGDFVPGCVLPHISRHLEKRRIGGK